MLKIAIISTNFTEDRFQKRWKLFAETYKDYEVFLLIPDKRRIGFQAEYTFGNKREEEGIAFDEENCHGQVFKIRYHKYIAWTSSDINKILRSIKPHIVYYIGLHNQETILQIIFGKKKYFPKSKLIIFSMRGPQHNITRPTDTSIIKRLIKTIVWKYELYKRNYIYENCDAICCHYPEAKQLFEKEGVKKKIYIQTQIGVDADVYCRNLTYREQIRDIYKIRYDEFLFGCAIRFAKEKGIEIILESMKYVDAKLLLMGSGNVKENKKVDELIIEYELEEKVIRTGYILGDEMAKYWNAVDCAIHVPLSTRNWVETFSLAVVQAMSTGIPIIGSKSGSVPYQIGFDELIVEEGNALKLAEKMNVLKNNEEIRNIYSNKLVERIKNNFDIRVLNREMHQICEEVL